jgi:hypothetical protein
VVHVGLLEQLKQFLIEYVLHLDKKYKQESQVKTYYLVAEEPLLVVWDVMEDILNNHGNISLKLVLLPEIYTKIIHIVNHMLSPLVITM